MHAQWNRLTPIMALWLVAGTALAQDNPRRQPPVAPTHDTRPGLADDARLLVRPRDRIGPAINPGEVGPVQPVGPQIDSGVHQPLDFTIGGYATTEVGMRWWHQGAPQTKVSRSIGGGAWSVIQTFGPLPANAYIDFRDLQAAPDTENCNRVAASDGRSEEHTSELQSLMRISYAVYCLTKPNYLHT